MRKIAAEVSLNTLAFLRMVAVIGILVLSGEREWIGVGLLLIVFAVTSRLIGLVLDHPTDESIRMLTEALQELRSSRAERD